LLLFAPVFVGAQTPEDTTRFKVFDRSKSFVVTGAQLKTYIGSYSDEQAQDAVGGMVNSTLEYNDATPSLGVKTQISITSDGSGVKLSGDESSPGNFQFYGTNGSGTKGFHDPRPYAVYVANVTQSGGVDPVAVVLENTTGATLTWTRIGPGQYRIAATGLFSTPSKLSLPGARIFVGGDDSDLLLGSSWIRIDNNTLEMRTTELKLGFLTQAEWNNTDDGFTVEIRIYP